MISQLMCCISVNWSLLLGFLWLVHTQDLQISKRKWVPTCNQPLVLRRQIFPYLIYQKSTFFGRIVYMLFDQLYKYRTRNREIGRDLIYFSCMLFSYCPFFNVLTRRYSHEINAREIMRNPSPSAPKQINYHVRHLLAYN